MPPVARIALIPCGFGKGEVIVRAFECLRIAHVPAGGMVGRRPTNDTAQAKHRKKATAALLAVGFHFRELR
jgi:hypothetical protein